jgi:hypothetical protein
MVAAANSLARHIPSGAARTWSTIVRWLPIALIAAAVLLVGVLVIAVLSPESSQAPAHGPPFVTGNILDAATIFGKNLLVLALFAMGNVAAFVIQRWRTAATGPPNTRTELMTRLAIAMVLGLLLFAAFRQAYALGHRLAAFSGYFYVSRWRLWLGVLPHALPELTGVFLPAAAWIFAARQGKQRDLFTLTIAATLAALPLLATAALLEVYVSPSAFRALTCIGASEEFHAGGGNCAPEPRECPKLSVAEFERRYHIHLSRAEIAGGRRHCQTSSRTR